MKNFVILALDGFILGLSLLGLFVPVSSEYEVFLPHNLAAIFGLLFGVLIPFQLFYAPVKAKWLTGVGMMLLSLSAIEFVSSGTSAISRYVSHVDLFVLVPAGVTCLIIALEQWQAHTVKEAVTRRWTEDLLTSVHQLAEVRPMDWSHYFEHDKHIRPTRTVSEILDTCLAHRRFH